MNPDPVEFGCIVELHYSDVAQEPSLAHISYVDPEKEYAVMWMLVDQNYRVFQMNSRFELTDTALSFYKVNSYPTDPGYARQTGLVPDQWIEIRLKEDPVVYIGQIMEIVEDMITVHLTTPSSMVVYFDFEYRGLIPELGIHSFTKIAPPAERPIRVSETSAEAEVDEDPFYNEEGERVDSNPMPVYGIEEGVEEMEDDISVVLDVEIKDNQKQFDLKRQLTEIVDKLYATYGERTVTPLMHAHIADVVDRFVISRNTYTNLDEHGNAIGAKKAFEGYRPFQTQFETRSSDMKRCPFAWPVSTLQKTLLFVPDEKSDDETKRDELMQALPQIDGLTGTGPEDFVQVLPQIDRVFTERQIRASNLSYLEKLREIQLVCTPFDRVEPARPNTSTHPIETLVRNGMPPQPQLVFGYLPDGAIRYTNQARYTQTYLPDEYMNIHSIYKPAVPKSKYIRKSRYLNPHTQVWMKTALSRSSPLESAMWRPPSNIANPHVYPVTDPDIFPLLSVVVHSMAHQFRHCTSYQEALCLVEELDTLPPQVDQNTANQLLHIVQKNIEDHKQNTQMHYAYIQKLAEQWNHPSPTYPEGMELLREYSNAMAHPWTEDVLEYVGTRMDPIERRHLAMESDSATLLALMDRYKNAKLYTEQSLATNMAELDENIPRLAKQYETKEALLEDSDNVLFFDKEYDITPYGLLKKYATEQNTMSESDFREWFQETLVQRHGIPPHQKAEMADWILAGHRPVMEGHYAKVNSPPSFYKRTPISSWELDETVTSDMFMSAAQLMKQAELQPSLESDNSMVDTYDVFRQTQLDSEINRRVASVFSSSVTNIQELIQKQKQRMATHQAYTYRRDMRAYINQYHIGTQVMEEQPILSSPFFPVLSDIREYGGTSKDVLIVQFYNTYCTDSSMLHLPTDPSTRYWKYCKETGIRLLPTSEYELAKLMFFRSEEQIQLERARIFSEVAVELDGNMYDKYTGYLLQEGIFEFQEQFTEDGRLIRSHEIITSEDVRNNERVEQQLNENPLESILPTPVADVIQFIDSIQHKKETTSYKLFEPVQYAMDLAANFKIGASQIQFALVRIASVVKSKIKSEADYNKSRKTSAPEYSVYVTTMYCIIAVNILLVSIHTAIPPLTTQPVISSYQSETTDMDVLWKTGMDKLFPYVKNLADNRSEPWVGLVNPTDNTIPSSFRKNALTFFKQVMLSSATIQSMYNLKVEYTRSVVERKQKERSTYDWPGFLPYLRPIQNLDAPRVRKTDSRNSIVNASYIQSLYILKQINDAIRTEPIIMQTLANVPYVENGCCNQLQYPIFPLDYFKERHQLKIDNTLRTLLVKNQALYAKQTQTAFFFTTPCPRNARDIEMEQTQFNRDRWTDSIQYAFLIYYLNLNETRGFIGVPAQYLHVLSKIPTEWNKAAEVSDQLATFPDVLAKLSLNGMSLEDFIRDMWAMEIGNRPLWVPTSFSVKDPLFLWTTTEPSPSEKPLSEIVQSNQLRVSAVKEALSAWLNTSTSNAYQPYIFKGLDHDAITERVLPEIQRLSSQFMSKLDDARKCLDELESKVNALYVSPKSFHEVIGFIRNMIFVDTTMSLVKRDPDYLEPFKVSTDFDNKTFMYVMKPFVTLSMQMHLKNIRAQELFDPWVQLVTTLMTLSPLATEMDGTDSSEEDDPYVYQGLPPYVMARLFQYAWLNIWTIWYQTALQIPESVYINLAGNADEEEDVYSRSRVSELVISMMKMHLRYHHKSMLDILMTDADIAKQTHLSKQSEKKQITDQYNKMNQKDRNLQRALIMCGLARYRLNAPGVDANEPSEEDWLEAPISAEEEGENVPEEEGIDMFTDGNPCDE